MYKDIITYQLADGITEDRLIEIASLVYNDWMKDLEGFVSWEITREHDGEYKDIVSWNHAEDARASEKLMADMPHGEDWIALYKPGTIRSNPVETLKILVK